MNTDAVGGRGPGAGRGTPLVSGRGLAAALDRPLIAVLIFSVAIIKLGGLGVRLSRSFDPQDFSVYYCAGLVLRHGQNPYNTDLLPIATRLGLEKGYILHANDPPTFLVSFEPLTLLSVHHAYWAWQAINLAAFAVSLILLFAPKDS